MKIKNQSSCMVACLFSFCTLLVNASELPLPKVNVVDKFGVNLANGQISQSAETVSIGGAMGLSHSISGFTNNFSFTGSRGYHDKYIAKAIYRQTGQNVFWPSAPGCALPASATGSTAYMLYTLNVSDFSETASFLICVNGVLAPDSATANVNTGYVYKALVDQRHTLEVDTDTSYLVWTKPNGTVVKFKRQYGAGSSYSATSGALLEKVIAPNGVVISVTDAMPSSVRSNTGFQLKYFYSNWNTVMDKPDTAVTGVPPASTWGANPQSIKGINAAIEYCSDTAATCTLTKPWPTATFSWPSGMPRTLYINYAISSAHPTLESGVMSVTNSQGKKTEFHFQAQDLTKDCLGIPAQFTPTPSVIPRLVGIKTADSSVVNIQYSFCNVASAKDYNGSFIIHPELVIDSEVGTVANAQIFEEGTAYNLAVDKWHSPDLFNSGGASNVREVVTRGGYAGNLSYVKTIEGQTNYEVSWRDFPINYFGSTGSETYGYDARGNMNSLCKNTLCTTASFPATCTSATAKICNQAIWIKDPKGNQTDYTYHTESGEVQSVTQPANKNGVRAQTRYEYTALSAKYYDSTGTKITGTPIWLKTAERYCTNSNYTGSLNASGQWVGSCGAGDQEVITRFEYNSDNLFLTGSTVTADGKTLRTCFKYDIYGNQISKTLPRAGLASCN